MSSTWGAFVPIPQDTWGLIDSRGDGQVVAVQCVMPGERPDDVIMLFGLPAERVPDLLRYLDYREDVFVGDEDLGGRATSAAVAGDSHTAGGMRDATVIDVPAPGSRRETLGSAAWADAAGGDAEVEHVRQLVEQQAAALIEVADMEELAYSLVMAETLLLTIRMSPAWDTICDSTDIALGDLLRLYFKVEFGGSPLGVVVPE